MREQSRASRAFRLASVAEMLLAGTALGCASSHIATAETEDGAATSEIAVHSFLDAANAEDYRHMGLLFGTREGPAVDRFGVTDVEQRMIFLSKLLKHESYRVRQANLAQLGPDRVRFVVEMTGTRKGAVSVPIVTVPTSEGRWFVEQLDVSALSASTVP